MNRVFNALKLDLYAAKSTLRLMAIIFAVCCVLGFVLKRPYFTTLICMLFGTYMGGGLFSVYEKNNVDKLYGILPLKKSEMVMGRYMYALVIGLACIILGGAAYPIISMIVGVPFDNLSWFMYVAISFLYYCFAAGVQYPIFMRVPFSKANVYAMVPMILIYVGIILFTQRSDLLSSMNAFTQFFSTHQPLILVCGFGLGLVFLAISAFISHAISAYKEL